MIVVDASVVVTALADDGRDGDRARERVRGERLIAPHLIDVEVVSAWRGMATAGNLDGRRVELALRDLHELRMERVPHGPLLDRCWELRSNLTIYDALYIALAEAVDAKLLTADTKLAASRVVECDVEVFR